jgi:hypothetical protein
MSPQPALAVAAIMATTMIGPATTNSFLSVFILKSPLKSNLQGCCLTRSATLGAHPAVKNALQQCRPGKDQVKCG